MTNPDYEMPSTEKVQEICLIAPTRQLAEKARGIIARRGDPVDVFLCGRDHDGIVALATELQRRGARLLISRKGTQQIIQESTDIQVVGLNNTLVDYMRMLLDPASDTDKVAFFSYSPLSPDVLRMCELLHIHAKNYTFTCLADCHDCVAQAMADGSTYGIGGAWTELAAREAGFPHLTVENSEESIVNALDVADQIRGIQKEELAKQVALHTRLEMYQAVLNFTHDAIMAVDDTGTVQIVNPVAERIIGKPADRLVGQPVAKVLNKTKIPEVIVSGRAQLNQIMQINQTLTNTNRVPILVDGQVRGVVATFQDIRQLQSTEQKIRLKLHEKGLVAKYSFSDILGDSPAIRDTIQMARSYADSDAAVLIHGETGTGKELFAQSIHNAGARRNGPFVALNCAAVSSSLLESELFGYEEGAFTGASRGGREGLFELAHGGTLFLDEIGEISMETQVDLLRVLQEKEIRRVGGSRVIPVDVRIITATNRDLVDAILNKRFREDLYYRLNVLDLGIPPLRERGGDVEILGLDFFRSLCECRDPALEARFLQLLRQTGDYPWYGNIRELQNFAERVHVLLKNRTEHFFVMTEMMRRRSQGVEDRPAGPESAENERLRILAALSAHPDSKEDAARSLGYSRQTLWRKMKKYGLDP